MAPLPSDYGLITITSVLLRQVLCMSLCLPHGIQSGWSTSTGAVAKWGMWGGDMGGSGICYGLPWFTPTLNHKESEGQLRIEPLNPILRFMFVKKKTTADLLNKLGFVFSSYVYRSPKLPMNFETVMILINPQKIFNWLSFEACIQHIPIGMAYTNAATSGDKQWKTSNCD